MVIFRFFDEPYQTQYKLMNVVKYDLAFLFTRDT